MGDWACVDVRGRGPACRIILLAGFLMFLGGSGTGGLVGESSSGLSYWRRYGNCLTGISRRAFFARI